MHRSHTLFLLFGITGATLLVLVMGGYPNHLYNTNPASSTAAIQSRPATLGTPVRLRIPKIHVDALIESVGLTSKGDLEIPKEPMHVAWYTGGPRPGEIGSAVMDGHFGWKDNLPAVFDDLSSLRAGDTLSVEDSLGVQTVFVVRELRNYNPAADASAVFNSTDGKAHLNLITCEGIWDAATKSYSGRLVVFTDKI